MRDDERFHRADHRTNGRRPEGMSTRAHQLEDEPIDLVAVQADDELISALASGMRVTTPGFAGYDADDRVAAILAAWREEVDRDPIPELVDIDTAIETIRSAGRPQRSRARRHLAPVAAAAAFAVFALGGVSVGSASAEPGDALWGISKVLFSERATSIEAAARVGERIDRAKRALTEGQPEVAAAELAEAQAELAVVRPEEGREQLAEVQNFLAAKAEETPPGQPTDPGQPLRRDRHRRVPHGAAVGADPSSAPPTEPTTGGSTAPGTGPATGGSSQPAQDPRTLDDPSASPGTSPSTTTTPSSGSTSATPEGSPSSTTAGSGQSMGSTPGVTSTAARPS
ncbi:Anti-sigma-D factor RsdA to sigma factor binding region [Pseudonocardia thermophila]|jgi:Predicted solute binding protein|uniref:Anti-sigma-D factor RsdA to sigma factor binding region n=1 Tax=Pseudonocardia thermophila TaxID=1848 RepID=A0A1M6X3B0_PSETH|nr:anti-sigma-D factor RsdA [Pseudonocardia thermophila]SHL00339.1 Anti-sigma-D factor RsdA to sigma factor binding region [Pseudonocardia thermophila]